MINNRHVVRVCQLVVTEPAGGPAVIFPLCGTALRAVHHLSCIVISAESGTTPAFLNLARAEDHPQSSGEPTRPARTGLHSMYSMELRIAFPLHGFRSKPAPACQIVNLFTPSLRMQKGFNIYGLFKTMNSLNRLDVFPFMFWSILAISYRTD